MEKVVVTGAGAVTPLGNSFTESWENLVKGKSGITEITRFDVSMLPYMVAGQIKNFQHNLTVKEARRYDPFIQYALVAAEEALHAAGLNGSGAAQYLTRGAVFIGTSRAGISSLNDAMRKMGTKARGGRAVSPYLMPSSTGSMAASTIAQRYGLKGECLGFSNACASGLVAIGNAVRSLRHGYYDMVIAGGTDAPLCPLCLEGYGSMGALSKMRDQIASRPFDRDRDGFVLAEGACVLILETLGSAKKRGANVLGEIAGYGGSTDAFHQTRPSADGECMAMNNALNDCDVDSNNIGFISAHATSTRLGDSTESEALKTVLGEKRTVPVTALKSSTGHMLAGSSAFETAVALRSLREGLIPPTINTSNIDPEYGVNVVTGLMRTEAEYAMVNSFGFGGVNAVAVLKRTGERL